MLSFKLITSIHAVFVVICILNNSGTGQSLDAGRTGSEQKSGHLIDIPLKFMNGLQELGIKAAETIQKKYPPTYKLELKSPGYFDYAYLAYDIAKPLRAYTKEEISEKELCKRLFGAATGFGGSVVGTSLGAYGGTLVSPAWGTFFGGNFGGQIGYYAGKKVGKEYIGEGICEYIIT